MRHLSPKDDGPVALGKEKAMALKEMKGETHEKVMIASGALQGEPDETWSAGSILAGVLILVLCGALLITITAPMWLLHS